MVGPGKLRFVQVLCQIEIVLQVLLVHLLRVLLPRADTVQRARARELPTKVLKLLFSLLDVHLLTDGGIRLRRGGSARRRAIGESLLFVDDTGDDLVLRWGHGRTGEPSRDGSSHSSRGEGAMGWTSEWEERERERDSGESLAIVCGLSSSLVEAAHAMENDGDGVWGGQRRRTATDEESAVDKPLPPPLHENRVTVRDLSAVPRTRPIITRVSRRAEIFRECVDGLFAGVRVRGAEQEEEEVKCSLASFLRQLLPSCHECNVAKVLESIA